MRGAETYASEMDFKFLFDTRRMLFAIGYQVGSSALDPSYYDLLASEARLASFIGIAKNDVPVEHWFRLGRSLTMTAGNTALISWSGSMFEYLMPVLVMKSFPFTLLDQTYSGAVSRQIAYGRERGVPWGVSESAYNTRDRQQVYQYRAFGVPDLALKRGLSRDLVVAPYATLLALPVEPHQAMRNLAALEGEGALGPYGFRDAVDYTRPQLGSRRALVGAYMAHHIGMGLVALTNALTRDVWPRRFHTDALVRSAELVLFEQIPRRFVLQDAQTGELEERPRRGAAALEKPAARSLVTADTPQAFRLGRAPRASSLHRDDHQRRRRVQPVRPPRRDPLAIGPDARRRRAVVLPQGRDTGGGGRHPAGRPVARMVRVAPARSQCAMRSTGIGSPSRLTGRPFTGGTATSRPVSK